MKYGGMEKNCPGKKNQSIHFDLETLGVSTSEQSINFQTFLRADLLTHSWGKTQLNLKNTQKLQSQIKKNDSSSDFFFLKKKVNSSFYYTYSTTLPT